MSAPICPVCQKPILDDGITLQDQLWHEQCAAQAIVTHHNLLQDAPPPPPPNNQRQTRSVGCCLGSFFSALSNIVTPLTIAGLLGGGSGGLLTALLIQLLRAPASGLGFFGFLIALLVGLITALLALLITVYILAPVWVIHYGMAATVTLIAWLPNRRVPPNTPQCPLCRRGVNNGVPFQDQHWHAKCLTNYQRKARNLDQLEESVAWLDMIFTALDVPLVFLGGMGIGAIIGFYGAGTLDLILIAHRPDLGGLLTAASIALGALLTGWSALRLRYWHLMGI